MRVSRLLDPVLLEVLMSEPETTDASIKASAIGPAISLECKAAQAGRAGLPVFHVLHPPQS
jgi:hypothetical protein